VTNGSKTVLDTFLHRLRNPPKDEWLMAHHEVIPEQAPGYEKIPSELDQRLQAELKTQIGRLYSHQCEAIRHALAGENVVLATNTASGKSLAFQVAVIDRLLKDPAAHALFLFPLKALERDQKESFLSLAARFGLTAAVYDGDTPDAERRKIRKNPPRVIITNPDMLHLSMLAFHDSWRELFSNLAYIVLDEVHTYKGIFGSHISQVLLRIRRICLTHGSWPQFFACSATIANPGDFVSTLVGQDVAVVDRSGAPSSERHFIFLDPTLSVYTITARLFIAGLEAGLKTIVFTKARKITELITTWVMQEAPHLRGRVSSYRAGFLPEERREIEAKLFSGEMDGVISTSALEMGIDVGGLDLCLLVGYPGTIVNTWQRGGRVGRASKPSAIVMIAAHDALDQYFLRNPGNFFERKCEEAVLDPLNHEVLKRHLPCAAAEIPIGGKEDWIEQPEIRTALEELEKAGVLYRDHEDGSWYSSRRKPQRQVDLRGIGQSFGIFLEGTKTLIGSSSGIRVFKECHEGAVYLHRTRQYLVTGLDLERRNVLVKPQRLNYFTKARSEKDTDILGAPIRSNDFSGFTIREARLKVTERVEAFEKRRTAGQDLIGVVELDLPPTTFDTVGLWIEIPEDVKDAISDAGLHFMGGIHALEHAAISLFPLYVLCDRDDIGGISTTFHEQVSKAAVFIYDGHPGGVGLAHRAYDKILDLLKETRTLVKGCACEDGCPSCIHSPKCGSGNKPLDKQACLAVLQFLLEPESAQKQFRRKKPKGPPIFPDLSGSSGRGKKSQTSRTSGGRVRAEPGSPDSRPEKASGQPGGRRLQTPHRSGPEQRSPLAEGVDMKTHPENVVVFDLETKKLADEVGGWKNIHKMGLSLAVIHSQAGGFMTFTEETVKDLIGQLKQAELIVGYNHVRFDYQVLSAYTSENLRALPNLDMLKEVHNVLGFRLKLQHLAEATLGEGKSGDGLDAVRWFKEGKMDLIEKYCRDDVRVTRDLYRFGLENGYLIYKRKNGQSARIPVNWGSVAGAH
jgi:DEAD/DEAH box helicase domain-containing protein